MDLSKLESIFGKHLLTKEGKVSTGVALKGKTTLCLYFSAQWCPPCRQFTPVLSEVYSSEEKGTDVEVVFISSDRDEASFDAYYGKMPWCALPFDAANEKADLSKEYGIRGIPTLVILKKDGTVEKNGREHVMEKKKLMFD
ncbi:tryparedoxin-like [Pecten maximus]|uniref:tryparedoxin-like n=1 Tax=Pecten maximus TaxID=6579 RepID=UPI001458C7ED|nr:tryparedoxin-like [Pecten maximus]